MKTETHALWCPRADNLNMECACDPSGKEYIMPMPDPLMKVRGYEVTAGGVTFLNKSTCPGENVCNYPLVYQDDAERQIKGLLEENDQLRFELEALHKDLDGYAQKIEKLESGYPVELLVDAIRKQLLQYGDIIVSGSTSDIPIRTPVYGAYLITRRVRYNISRGYGPANETVKLIDSEVKLIDSDVDVAALIERLNTSDLPHVDPVHLCSAIVPRRTSETIQVMIRELPHVGELKLEPVDEQESQQ